MIGVVNRNGEWVAENRGSFLETHSVLTVVLFGLLLNPLKAQSKSGSILSHRISRLAKVVRRPEVGDQAWK